LARSEGANVPVIRGNDRTADKRTVIVFLDICKINSPFNLTTCPLGRCVEKPYLLE